jgi:hypothetical protein
VLFKKVESNHLAAFVDHFSKPKMQEEVAVQSKSGLSDYPRSKRPGQEKPTASCGKQSCRNVTGGVGVDVAAAAN